MSLSLQIIDSKNFWWQYKDRQTVVVAERLVGVASCREEKTGSYSWVATSEKIGLSD